MGVVCLGILGTVQVVQKLKALVGEIMAAVA